MRSYYAHLETTAPATQVAIAARPTFRSSAIFPVLQQEGITARILFLGYWILKRNIKEIAVIVNLRDAGGTLLARNTWLIQEAKTYRIELATELERAGYPPKTPFVGSLEVEFFSTQNLVFPFPAVVINYYGPHFSTVVHTAQRVYNDFDDRQKNSQTAVPESGFNVYADEQSEPFLGLINGSHALSASRMDLQFVNSAQATLDCRCELGNLAPYETRFIYPARIFDLKNFLKGKPGAGKVRFDVDWIFPRLVVGNIQREVPAVTITHTYYDCSAASSPTDYWRPTEPGWQAAALMLPAIVANQHFTKVYFYPIYSPSSFAIDVEIYDTSGLLKGVHPQATLINAPQTEVHCIDVREICQKLDLDLQQDYAIRLIANPAVQSRLPARIKVGLDVGVQGQKMPCNICTNLQPFNPSLENKPTSFRWSPCLADQPQASLWIMNSSPAITYQRAAEVNLTFFHEQDSTTVTRTLVIPPHGFYILKLHEDRSLTDFFGSKVGWVTATTTNPYTTTYYFAENAHVVGGDHGF